MNKILPFLMMILVFLSGCGEGHEHHGHDSNAHMNKMSFDELVSRFESPDREKWQKPEEVINLLGEIEGKTIMDIGAGTGYFSFRMAAKGANVIAADVDDRFLNYIKERKTTTGDLQVEIRKTEFDDPLLGQAEVDHVIIVDTYHHIDDRVEYFKKVMNGLKVDGSLLVVDFKKEDSPNGPPKNHRIAADKVVNELKKAGFSEFQVDMEMLEYQYIIIAQKPG